ncbi:DUF1761 domain-containing protein [Actibacterium sp. D379-3]
MEYLSVIAAAAASYFFGAVWYMVLARPWMAAAGIETDERGRPKERTGAMPYVIAVVGTLFVAGMMRHVFALSGIDAPMNGVVSGMGLGLFIATPWLASNDAFVGRPFRLTLIDGGYTTIGCAIIGLVLTLF